MRGSFTTGTIGLIAALASCGPEAAPVTPAQPPPTAPAAAASSAPPPPAEVDAPSAAKVHPPEHAGWLSDGFEKRLRERVNIRRHGRARLRIDEKLDPFEPTPEEKQAEAENPFGNVTHFVTATVAETQEPTPEPAGDDSARQGVSVRIVFEARWARVLIWLDETQYYPTVSRRQALLVAPGASTPTPPLGESPDALPHGATLMPGIRLLLKGTRAGHTQVTAGADTDWAQLVAKGWLPTETLAPTYSADAATTPAGPQDQVFMWLTDSTLVRASPRGRVVASVNNKDATNPMQLVIRRVGSTGAWMQEVILSAGGLHLRGYVPKNKLAPADPTTSRYSAVHHAARLWREPSDLLLVQPGTCLYDSKDGRVIGVTRRLSQHRVKKRADGWRMLALTSFFSASPFVRLADVEVLQERRDLEAPKSAPLEVGKWGCSVPETESSK